MRKNPFHTGIILLAVLLGGCEINQKEILPEDGFLKIYNHPQKDLAYYPESVLELDQGGYILIAAVKDEDADIEYPYASLIRTNARGELSWNLDYDWLSPVSKLIHKGKNVAFVAMDQNFQAHAVEVDPSSGTIQATHDLEMTMPLAVFKDSKENLLVLGYDFVTRSSWISRYNNSFILQRSTKLPVNTDLEYLVQRHLNKTGQDYPFFIQSYSNASGTGYLVNCFYNYTLRTVFLDISSLEASGDIYSFQIEEGISSALQKTANIFAITSYYEGRNFIMPAAEIDVLNSGNIKDLSASPLYELTYKAGVLSKEIHIADKPYILIASQTNDNAIRLYQYAADSDSLIQSLDRNFDQRVEVKDILQSGDQGLVVLAGIYMLGKYPRAALLKIPSEEFDPEELDGV